VTVTKSKKVEIFPAKNFRVLWVLWFGNFSHTQKKIEKKIFEKKKMINGKKNFVRLSRELFGGMFPNARSRIVLGMTVALAIFMYVESIHAKITYDGYQVLEDTDTCKVEAIFPDNLSELCGDIRASKEFVSRYVYFFGVSLRSRYVDPIVEYSSSVITILSAAGGVIAVMKFFF